MRLPRSKIQCFLFQSYIRWRLHFSFFGFRTREGKCYRYQHHQQFIFYCWPQSTVALQASFRVLSPKSHSHPTSFDNLKAATYCWLHNYRFNTFVCSFLLQPLKRPNIFFMPVATTVDIAPIIAIRYSITDKAIFFSTLPFMRSNFLLAPVSKCTIFERGGCSIPFLFITYVQPYQQ